MIDRAMVSDGNSVTQDQTTKIRVLYHEKHVFPKIIEKVGSQVGLD